MVLRDETVTFNTLNMLLLHDENALFAILTYTCKTLTICYVITRGFRGGCGVRTPWKITKICFFSNTGPDPLERHKATKPTFNVGLSSAFR